MLHIALADDRLASLKKLIAHIENKVEVKLVIKATNGHDLILQMHLQNKPPDIVFVDINMPVMDGIATTHFLKLHYPSVKVIGLSIYDDLDTVNHIMESGACGYILKGDVESVVDIAIRKISDGEVYIDERVGFSEEEKNMILSKMENGRENIVFDLTPRERIFIILNATTLTYEQIAQTMFVETKTIQTYFDRVSKKLNVTSRQALTIFSFQNGLAKVAKLTNLPKFA